MARQPKAAARAIGAALADAAAQVAAAAGAAALDAASAGQKVGAATKAAAAQAGLQAATALLLRVLSGAQRWRAGLLWQPGQERVLSLADLSPAQLESLEADPAFTVEPVAGPAAETDDTKS
jgi:hypothetical protein